MKKPMNRGCLIQATSLIGVAALTILTSSSQAETVEELDKAFGVKSGTRLVVDVDFGSIDVTTQEKEEASIKVWRRVVRAEKTMEEEFLAERPVTFEQEGDTLTVRSRGPRKQGASGSQKTEGRYTIVLPAKFNVTLKTAGGAVAVQDLNGEVKASTSGGPLKFTQVQGMLDGQTSGGPIRLNNCKGSLKVKTSGGPIDAESGTGSLDGETSGGTVGVKGFRGAVRVETSGGGIKIEDVAGKIDGLTKGGSINASVTSLSDEVTLSTSGGGVTFRAPEDSAFNLDATTSSGDVRSEWSVVSDGKPSKQRLKGTVNGGGKPVILHTSGGTIRVNKL